MSMRSRRPVLALFIISLLGAGATRGQENEVLVLPRDEQRLDELTIRGTSERQLSEGLSRLTVPNSVTTYYVVDEVRAWQNHLRRAFDDIDRNDSDISIGIDTLYSEFIHLRVGANTQDVRYFKFERALIFQSLDFVREGAASNRNRSVEYLEYLFPIGSCSALGEAIELMEMLLRESVSSIGVPPEPVDVIVLDGISYQLRVRMGRALQGSFRVGENSGPLFDAVHSILIAVRECSIELEPDARTLDFLP